MGRSLKTCVSHQSVCRVGVAVRDITPPVGIYHRMWGAALHDRATGVHRPLEASCLWLEPADGAELQSGECRRLAVVTLDMCILWNAEMRQLEESVCRLANIQPDELRITFSHTHAAGLMDLSRKGMPGGELIEGYLGTLAAALADAVCEARAQRRPAHIVYGMGRCDLARHRDVWDDERQQFVCGLNPEGLADDTLVVAKITDERDVTLAVIVNYACHPTTLAWDNTLISPDFVGALREIVSKATGAPVIFLQGASGDLGPKVGFVADPAAADRNGRQLGYAVLSTLEGLDPPAQQYEYAGAVMSGAVIGTWGYNRVNATQLESMRTWQCLSWTVELPYREGLPERSDLESQLKQMCVAEKEAAQANDLDRLRELRARAEVMRRTQSRFDGLPPGETFPLPVTLLQIGGGFWLFVEAEHYQILQRWLRARFPGSAIIVTTLTGGTRPFYLPEAATYGTGKYPDTVAMLARGSLETLIENISTRMADWGAE